MKFRIWYNGQGVWLKDDDKYEYSVSCTGYVHARNRETGSRTTMDNCIIEQYTNVNDKNGKEIFVGDTVQYAGEWSGTTITGVVKWSDHHGRYIVDISLVGFQKTSLSSWVVTGNIHDY